jgi:Na+/proline symporter/CheY-like chemotaxis protein/anti-sigma regulatory factor (Ser/Thr protein kinase)
MPGPWLLALIALAYLGLLFAIAWVGDRWAATGRHPVPRPWIYSLSLAVYCTSWAFYGTVGQSATLGWWFPPTYVGTILLLLLIPGLLAKLIAVSRRERITSVADFVAARYGRDRSLAVAVTLIATCGIVPYVALQLKAIDQTFSTLTAAQGGAPVAETGLYVAATLALFAILFGTRHVDATEHHPGMMLAVAFESLVKLVAFAAVGAFVTWGLFDGFGDIARQVAAVPGLAGLRAEQSSAAHYLALAVLGFFAIFCLPRQFHVAVVENSGPADLRTARWLFPAYLVAISVFILPLANAGLVRGSGDADLFVLGLPLAAGAEGLALFAFIGGLSAATGMVIVASVALSTMVCNEIVMPLLMRLFPAWRERQDLTGALLGARRTAIVVLLALGWLYHRWIVGNDALASIGEISFAAVALFGPAIVAGLYWRGASRAGALASLGVGFAAWGWTLLVPTLAQAGLVPPSLLTDGPAGLVWLRPTALFGLELHALAHGLVWSLGLATVALLAVSQFGRRSLLERVQAASFVDAEGTPPPAEGQAASQLTARELRPLVERFIGGKRAARHFADLGWRGGEDARASAEQLEATRKLLASVVGASSAQRLVDAAVQGREVPLEDVVTLVGGASQALEFSRELLQSTLENVSQGISVVDADLKLVAWNRRYVEMYDYPPGFLRIGQPIEEVLRFNAARGRLRDGDGEGAIERRLAHLRRGTPYSLQRTNPDGTVLEIRGNPMPGGGFVTSYTDVTEYKRAEEALRVANESLEQRVRERTRALSAMNDELLAAKAEAERANAGKTRFLAAAGHDLMQPLNAAGLFAGALSQRARGDERALLADLESCLQSAEGLISDLLDISRLDTGVIRAQPEDLPLNALFDALDAEFRLEAGRRGLALTVRRTRAIARSDARLLRRVLQNFIANALRYTPAGRVLVGVRRRRGRVRIEVWDTGIGIAAEHQERVFEEFYRGGVRREADETRGFGLGLAIAERIARVLGHEIGLRSAPGRGSVFWIEVARGEAAVLGAATPLPVRATGALAGVRVLCIDNDPAALRGLATLLQSWGCETLSAQGVEELVMGRRLQSWRPDLIVVDYHLEGGATGLEVVRHLRAVESIRAPVLVVSADASDAVRQEAEALDCVFLRKPLKPLAVRSALSRLLETAA